MIKLRSLFLLPRIAYACAVALLFHTPLYSDVVETIGGSTLRGTILASDKGVIRIATEFGSTIEIPQDQIRSMTTEAPVFVALEDGNQVQGTLRPDNETLTIVGTSGSIVTSNRAISALWRAGDMSPADKAEQALRRRWASTLSFDLNGRQGNSDRFFVGIAGRTTLEGEDDRLAFFGNYTRGDESGEVTQDQAKLGVDYTNFFSDRFSWYTRTELGFDRIKDLDLRSESAAGIGYTFVDREKWTFEGRTGISYRFENYSTGEDFDSLGLDFGIINTYDFGWGEMLNRINYTPSFDDFGNFVITHESTVLIPVAGGERWNMRFGLKNDYTSRPPPGLVKHDWTYFSGMTLSWK